MNVICKFVKDLLTGIDGESYDIGRVLWALACLVGFGLEIHGVYANTPFDLQQYGLGVGALLGSGALSLKLKSTTEPSA